MKMIIIDDEIGIANSIKSIFDWSKLGIEEVFVFDLAVDALTRIKDGDIDILMTDIRMPEMDGLELSRRAIEITPEMKIIMCSGFDDFEYAQAAMRIGVMEYLLKPVTVEEVTAAVKRAADKRHQEKLRNRIKTEYESNMDIYIQNAKNMLSARFIQKNTPLKEDELKKYFEILGMKDFPQTGCVACIRIMVKDNNEPWNMPQDFPLLCFAIDNVLNEILVDKGSSFYDGSNSTVLLMFGEKEKYPEFVERCVNALRTTLGIEMSVGVGEITDDVSSMYNSYCSALAACQHGAFYKKSGICSIDDIKISYSYPEKLEKQLIEGIAFVNSKKDYDIETVINEYFEEIKKNANIPAEDIKTICNNILIACAKRLLSLDKRGEAPVISRWLEKSGEIETIDDLRQNLVHHMQKARELIDSWSNDKSELMVEEAKKYIDEHISEDLSLETISRMFFFSTRYFAKLFKEYTGKNYSDYVNYRKMENAKQYLINTDFSIGEIGRKVGYEDQGHFCRNFKKYIGVNPSEYRKRK